MSTFLDLLLSVRKKPVRTCRTMHACCACDKPIQVGQRYHDGGFGKRAHVACLNRVASEETGALPTISRMEYIEEFIYRMERHSATQINVSCNSPSWIGYHNAMQQCLEELERYDAAENERHE